MAAIRQCNNEWYRQTFRRSVRRQTELFWSLCHFAIFAIFFITKIKEEQRIRKQLPQAIKHHHGPYRGTAQEDPDQAGRRPRLPEGRGECSILPTSTIRVFDDDGVVAKNSPFVGGVACSPLLGGDSIMRLATFRPTFAAAPSVMDVASVGVRRWDHPVPVGRRVQ